ncbi:MAG: PQQ-like beta-propeller repeat protein, partial [Phycisphaerae bacterium]|nr:PQQ-like beta-propeller repeat protein [Phycisphaerae bacterium]
LIVKVDGRDQIISSNSMACMSYDPLTGSELWKVIHKVDGTVMRPVFADGVVYISAGDQPDKCLWAVRADGQGDVTDTNVIWKCEKGPCVSSPIVKDGLLYMVTDKGLVSCVDVKTGKRIWQQQLVSGTYWSSAVFADGRLYFNNDKGDTTVMAAGRTAKILGVNKLDDGIYASPAVIEGSLIQRTTTHLYCLGKRENK